MDRRFLETGPALGFLLDTRSWSPLMEFYMSKPRCLEYDIRPDQRLKKARTGCPTEIKQTLCKSIEVIV
jgi:hypothetical protein